MYQSPLSGQAARGILYLTLYMHASTQSRCATNALAAVDTPGALLCRISS